MHAVFFPIGCHPAFAPGEGQVPPGAEPALKTAAKNIRVVLFLVNGMMKVQLYNMIMRHAYHREPLQKLTDLINR